MNDSMIKEKIETMKNVKIIASKSELFHADYNQDNSITVSIIHDNTVVQYNKQILKAIGMRITDDYASIILDSGDTITLDLDNGFLTLEQDKTYEPEEDESLLSLTYYDYPEFFKVSNLKESDFPIYEPKITSRVTYENYEHRYVCIVNAYLNPGMIIPSKIFVTEPYKDILSCIGKANSAIIDIENNTNFKKLGMCQNGLLLYMKDERTEKNIDISRIIGFGEYTVKTIDINGELIEYPYSSLATSKNWAVFSSSYIYIYESSEGEAKLDHNPLINLTDQKSKEIIDDFIKIVDIVPDPDSTLQQIRIAEYKIQNYMLEKSESLKIPDININEYEDLQTRIEIGLGLYQNLKYSDILTKNAIIYSDKRNYIYTIDDNMEELYNSYLEQIKFYIDSIKKLENQKDENN